MTHGPSARFVTRCVVAPSLALLLVAALGDPTAHADSGALFGDSSRAASLADAVTARGGDTSNIYDNPAGLAALERPVLALGAHAGRLDLWYARDGEPGQALGEAVNGFLGSLALRLPGPPWLRRVRLGVSAYVPSSYALRLTAPVRDDVPLWPLYGDRAGRTAVTGALAVALPYGFGIGLGLTIIPDFYAPTLVTYDARRGDTPDQNVVIDLERELSMHATALAGLRWQPVRALAFGLAFRQAQTVHAFGPQNTRAGSLDIPTPIDFYEVFAPMEVAFGVLVRPVRRLSVSADAVWSHWSSWRSIHDLAPTPAFHDVVNVRTGVEWSPRRFFAVRAGWAYEPSPVPPQTGQTDFLDGSRQVLALGLGLDLEKLGLIAMRIDAHLRWHLIASQHTQKDPAALPDADPMTPGTQIDALGYPGFSAGGSFVEAGVTLGFYLARPPLAHEVR